MDTTQKPRIVILIILIWMVVFYYQRQTRRHILCLMLDRQYHDGVRKRKYRYRYRLPISYARQQWSLELSGWGDTECREYLRFTKAEIAQLLLHFDFQGSEIFINRLKNLRCPATGEHALCMVLYRLAWPTRLKDMIQTFGYSRSYISNVVNTTVSRNTTTDSTNNANTSVR